MSDPQKDAGADQDEVTRLQRNLEAARKGEKAAKDEAEAARKERDEAKNAVEAVKKEIVEKTRKELAEAKEARAREEAAVRNARDAQAGADTVRRLTTGLGATCILLFIVAAVLGLAWYNSTRGTQGAQQETQPDEQQEAGLRYDFSDL